MQKDKANIGDNGCELIENLKKRAYIAALARAEKAEAEVKRLDTALEESEALSESREKSFYNQVNTSEMLMEQIGALKSKLAACEAAIHVVAYSGSRCEVCVHINKKSHQGPCKFCMDGSKFRVNYKRLMKGREKE